MSKTEAEGHAHRSAHLGGTEAERESEILFFTEFTEASVGSTTTSGTLRLEARSRGATR
jgi:hypothetical protein